MGTSADMGTLADIGASDIEKPAGLLLKQPSLPALFSQGCFYQRDLGRAASPEAYHATVLDLTRFWV
jgi:hypothetical protein